MDQSSSTQNQQQQQQQSNQISFQLETQIRFLVKELLDPTLAKTEQCISSIQGFNSKLESDMRRVNYYCDNQDKFIDSTHTKLKLLDLLEFKQSDIESGMKGVAQDYDINKRDLMLQMVNLQQKMDSKDHIVKELQQHIKKLESYQDGIDEKFINHQKQVTTQRNDPRTDFYQRFYKIEEQMSEISSEFMQQQKEIEVYKQVIQDVKKNDDLSELYKKEMIDQIESLKKLVESKLEMKQVLPHIQSIQKSNDQFNKGMKSEFEEFKKWAKLQLKSNQKEISNIQDEFETYKLQQTHKWEESSASQIELKHGVQENKKVIDKQVYFSEELQIQIEEVKKDIEQIQQQNEEIEEHMKDEEKQLHKKMQSIEDEYLQLVEQKHELFNEEIQQEVQLRLQQFEQQIKTEYQIYMQQTLQQLASQLMDPSQNPTPSPYSNSNTNNINNLSIINNLGQQQQQQQTQVFQQQFQQSQLLQPLVTQKNQSQQENKMQQSQNLQNQQSSFILTSADNQSIDMDEMPQEELGTINSQGSQGENNDNGDNKQLIKDILLQPPSPIEQYPDTSNMASNQAISFSNTNTNINQIQTAQQLSQMENTTSNNSIAMSMENKDIILQQQKSLKNQKKLHTNSNNLQRSQVLQDQKSKEYKTDRVDIILNQKKGKGKKKQDFSKSQYVSVPRGSKLKNKVQDGNNNRVKSKDSQKDKNVNINNQNNQNNNMQVSQVIHNFLNKSSILPMNGIKPIQVPQKQKQQSQQQSVQNSNNTVLGSQLNQSQLLISPDKNRIQQQNSVLIENLRNNLKRQRTNQHQIEQREIKEKRKGLDNVKDVEKIVKDIIQKQLPTTIQKILLREKKKDQFMIDTVQSILEQILKEKREFLEQIVINKINAITQAEGNDDILGKISKINVLQDSLQGDQKQVKDQHEGLIHKCDKIFNKMTTLLSDISLKDQYMENHIKDYQNTKKAQNRRNIYLSKILSSQGEGLNIVQGVLIQQEIMEKINKNKLKDQDEKLLKKYILSSYEGQILDPQELYYNIRKDNGDYSKIYYRQQLYDKQELLQNSLINNINCFDEIVKDKKVNEINEYSPGQIFLDGIYTKLSNNVNGEDLTKLGFYQSLKKSQKENSFLNQTQFNSNNWGKSVLNRSNLNISKQQYDMSAKVERSKSTMNEWKSPYNKYMVMHKNDLKDRQDNSSIPLLNQNKTSIQNIIKMDNYNQEYGPTQKCLTKVDIKFIKKKNRSQSRHV